jgi:hypothetical protein
MAPGRGSGARDGGARAPRRGSAEVGPGGWLLLFAVFLGAALQVYGPALDGPFLSDDFHYVAENTYVHDLTLDNVAVLLDPTGTVAIDIVNYSPVQLLVHALVWQAVGTETFGHHLVNVVLHALASVLLVALFLQTGVPRLAALFAGGFFLLHPANVEAVAWISQLKTTLSLVLSVGALLAWARRPGLASGLFALALLAKPTAAAVLPAALLLDWTREDRVRWRWLALQAAAFAAFAAVEFGAHQRTGAAEATLYETPLLLVRTIAAIGARYLAMAASSWGTSAFHDPDPARSLLDPWWLASLPLAGLLVWRILVVARRRAVELVWWTWAAVSFGPISQIFPFLYPMGDRYLYFILPGLIGGVLGLGVEAVARVPEGKRLPAIRVSVVAGAMLLAVFGMLSHGRAGIWRSNAFLVADAAAHYPDGVAASLLAAKRAALAADADGAVAALRRAHERGFHRFEQLEADPGYAAVRDDPAFRALVREMAATWIASAERKPEPTQAELQSLARAYIARGELEQALEALERGVALGGPRTAQLAAEARAVRAGIESGNRERVRIGVGSQR